MVKNTETDVDSDQPKKVNQENIETYRQIDRDRNRRIDRQTIVQKAKGRNNCQIRKRVFILRCTDSS